MCVAFRRHRRRNRGKQCQWQRHPIAMSPDSHTFDMKTPPGTPAPEPEPKRDPEPEPGSDPDLVPGMDPLPEPLPM